MKTRNIKVMGLKDVRCVVEDLNTENLKDNEAIIKNEMSLISSGTELSRVYGIKKGVEYPMDPGYISVGRIIKKGKGLTHVEEGDRVIYNGAHKEYQRFEHNGRNLELILKVDDDLELKEAALIYLASVAMNGVYGTDIKLGDKVAVFGLGPIGLITAKLYQLAGVDVIAIDPVEGRCDDAKALGIKEVVSCEPKDQIEKVMELTEGRGVDIAVDVAGVSPAIETAVQVAAFNGQVILTGSPRADYHSNVTTLLNRIHMRMLTVKGAYNGLYPFYESEGSRLSVERGMEYIKDALRDKSLDSDILISHIVSPEDAQETYRGLMEDRENYKCAVFDWSLLEKGE